MTLSAQKAIEEMEQTGLIFTPEITTPKSVITIIPTITSGKIKPIGVNSQSQNEMDLQFTVSNDSPTI